MLKGTKFEEFIDWVLAEMGAQGLNQAEMCRRTGIGTSTLSRILDKQQKGVHSSTVYKLKEALGEFSAEGGDQMNADLFRALMDLQQRLTTVDTRLNRIEDLISKLQDLPQAEKAGGGCVGMAPENRARVIRYEDYARRGDPIK